MINSDLCKQQIMTPQITSIHGSQVTQTINHGPSCSGMRGCVPLKVSGIYA